MRLYSRVLIAILSVALFAPDTATSQTASEDRAALMALYDATNGASWRNSTNWDSSRPLGEWYGVTTDTNRRVTELSLWDNELTGEIPAALGSLTSLVRLSLSGNRLTGEIPAALARFESTINPQLRWCGPAGSEHTGPSVAPCRVARVGCAVYARRRFAASPGRSQACVRSELPA